MFYGYKSVKKVDFWPVCLIMTLTLDLLI